MGSFYLDYRDPLFGIMVFLLILFVAAVLYIVVSKIKQNTEAKKIKKYLRKFPSNSQMSDYVKLLETHPNSFELLSKVARAHFDGGDYDKSLKIYLALLDWLSSFERAKRAQVFELLGDVYAKSGFLERSVDAYEQSLSLVARNKTAIFKLANVYEKRGSYEKMIEALEALSQMGCEQKSKAVFAEGMLRLTSVAGDEEKGRILKSMYGLSDFFDREYVKWLLKKDEEGAIGFLNTVFEPKFLDIVWSHSFGRKEFDGIGSPLLRSVLAAKSLLEDDGTQSGVFEVDVVRGSNLSKNGVIADLAFEFACQKCSNIDIDYFFSCKNCGESGCCVILPNIVRKSDDKDYILEDW